MENKDATKRMALADWLVGFLLSLYTLGGFNLMNFFSSLHFPGHDWISPAIRH